MLLAGDRCKYNEDLTQQCILVYDYENLQILLIP